MNLRRRKHLENVAAHISTVREELYGVMLEESEYRGRLPAEMQDGAHCEKSKQLSMNMAAAYAYLSSAARALKRALEEK